MTATRDVEAQLRADLRASDAFFLVWGPPSHGPRSRVLARKLDIEPVFVSPTPRRGLLAAPFKYPRQALQTVQLLHSRRPKLVFVQSPPSFAPLILAIVGKRTGTSFIADGHSDAFQAFHWTRPKWLFRWTYRAALATIVTNEAMADDLSSFGARSMILRDVPTEFPGTGGSYPAADGLNIAVVSTFADDEPLAEVLEAARRTPHVTYHITGKVASAPADLISSASANVVFTDFLPDEKYYDLLRVADAVMCLTTRNNTMQRGACEALSLERPVITSDWPLLRTYFHKGAVFVDPTADSITNGVTSIEQNSELLQRQMTEMKTYQENEWHRGLEELRDLVEARVK